MGKGVNLLFTILDLVVAAVLTINVIIGKGIKESEYKWFYILILLLLLISFFNYKLYIKKKAIDDNNKKILEANGIDPKDVKNYINNQKKNKEKK